MPRAFTAADVIQSNSGVSSVAVTDPGVALSSPAVEGRSGLIVMGAQTVIAAPQQWDIVAGSGAAAGSPQLGVMVRAGLPDGDQSWAFQALGGTSTYWSWLAEEWTNISYAPLLGTANTSTIKDPASATYTIGPTGSWSAPYAVGIAALFMLVAIQSGDTPTLWPSVSWSDGFTETDVLTRGDGTTSSDMQLRVARRYGTLDDAGAWSTTATFDALTNSKNCYGVLAVLRAEDEVAVPATSTAVLVG